MDNFLARLPPATTERNEDVPWIFICNPYIPRLEKCQSNGDFVRGNEDEAPVEEGSQLALIVQGGMERLALVLSLKKRMEEAGKSLQMIQREMGKERKKASQDILNLAHAGKVRTGKARTTPYHEAHLHVDGASFADQPRAGTSGFCSVHLQK